MIKYDRQHLKEVKEEIAPMLDAHYEEVAMYQDHIELNPQWEMYENLELMDRLFIFTMRDEGKLIGYSVFFLNPHMHYADHEFAMNDIVYIDPDRRGTEETVNFFKWCEKHMRDCGTSVISYHMKVYKPFQTLMTILGYDHAEHMYTKYIGS